jgi:RNA polymerase sigma-70 factor (ECF subfamily)
MSSRVQRKWKDFATSCNYKKRLKVSDALWSTEFMTPSQTSDEHLLHELRAGKESAFRELYAQYQGILFRFALHMTGSAATAEDIAHDVFIELISKPGSYKASQGPLSAYLFGITRNLARASLRGTRASRALDDVAEAEIPLVSDTELIDCLSSSEALESLRRALLALPEPYREVVVLCDLEEMPYAQAAIVLECSAGTIASRLHRAHNLLRAKLVSMSMASKAAQDRS